MCYMCRGILCLGELLILPVLMLWTLWPIIPPILAHEYLYLLVSGPVCLMLMFFAFRQVKWNWRREPKYREEIIEEKRLQQLVQDDRWKRFQATEHELEYLKLTAFLKRIGFRHRTVEWAANGVRVRLSSDAQNAVRSCWGCQWTQDHKRCIGYTGIITNIQDLPHPTIGCSLMVRLTFFHRFIPIEINVPANAITQVTDPMVPEVSPDMVDLEFFQRSIDVTVYNFENDNDDNDSDGGAAGQGRSD
eukprot:c13079_g1_i1.p1 GENE.c13079_g1_i1~~c13079_g1_i1.p1  ORF type:complete len:247 (-),score=49.70 c13079_g1_i1:45-785(-)